MLKGAVGSVPRVKTCENVRRHTVRCDGGDVHGSQSSDTAGKLRSEITAVESCPIPNGHLVDVLREGLEPLQWNFTENTETEGVLFVW